MENKINCSPSKSCKCLWVEGVNAPRASKVFLFSFFFLFLAKRINTRDLWVILYSIRISGGKLFYYIIINIILIRYVLIYNKKIILTWYLIWSKTLVSMKKLSMSLSQDWSLIMWIRKSVSLFSKFTIFVHLLLKHETPHHPPTPPHAKPKPNFEK